MEPDSTKILVNVSISLKVAIENTVELSIAKNIFVVFQSS